MEKQPNLVLKGFGSAISSEGNAADTGTQLHSNIQAAENEMQNQEHTLEEHMLSNRPLTEKLLHLALEITEHIKQEQAAFEANARRRIIRQWFFDVLAALAFCFCVASMVALYVTYLALTQGL